MSLYRHICIILLFCIACNNTEAGSIKLLANTAPSANIASSQLNQLWNGLSTAQGGAWASATEGTYRQWRTMPVGIIGDGNTIHLTFTYTNWYTGNSPLPVFETNGPGTITVSLTVEYNTSASQNIWLPNNAGARTVTSPNTLTLAPGQSGTLSIDVPFVVGAYGFYEQVLVSGASGWPVGVILTASSQCFDENAPGIDNRGSATGWTTTSIAMYGANRITANRITSRLKKVLAVGDSITLGFGNAPTAISHVDLAIGYTRGASATQQLYGLQKISEGSDTIQGWITSAANKRRALATAKYDLVVFALGLNDFGLNNRTVAQVQADLLTALPMLAAISGNAPIVLYNLTPETTGGNVNPPNGNFIANRNTYNAWLPTLIGSFNVVGVFNVAAEVESAPGANTWADIKLTVDFIHPSGGAVGTGTSGVMGTSGAGGGHASIAVAEAAFLASVLP